MSDLDILLAENLKDPEFAKAWKETKKEYQMKRELIEQKLDGNNSPKMRVDCKKGKSC